MPSTRRRASVPRPPVRPAARAGILAAALALAVAAALVAAAGFGVGAQAAAAGPPGAPAGASGAAAGAGAQAGSDAAAAERLATVRRVLAEVPLVDGHNDLPWQVRERAAGKLAGLDLAADLTGLDPALHTDVARLRQGGVGAQFWSVYVPVEMAGAEAVQATLEQIDVVTRMASRHPDVFELATTAGEVERIHRSGRIASLVGVEGGHSIGGSLAVLRQLHRLGARYMTLTHWKGHEWADAATSPVRHGGLSEFGREVVREMNRLGMLVDLSHVSAATMHDALDVAEAPVVFSHSSAAGVVDFPRNVPDDVLRRLLDNGGVVMVTFVPSFVSAESLAHYAAREAEKERLATIHPGDRERAAAELAGWDARHPAPRATLAEVADHVDHVRRVAGIDHVGLGSDFDGISSVPVGLEDVSTYPALLAELLARGYTAEEIGKVAGANVLRAMRRAEEVAAHLQAERGPSEALLTDYPPPPPEPAEEDD